jgi:hypothetical protein
VPPSRASELSCQPSAHLSWHDVQLLISIPSADAPNGTHGGTEQVLSLADAATGAASSCRERLQCLARLKAAHPDDLASWAPSDFKPLDGASAAALTPAMLASVPLHGVPCLRNALLAGLLPEQFAALSVSQLQQLQAGQVRVLTVRQLAALSRKQLAAFSPEQLDGSSTARRLCTWLAMLSDNGMPVLEARVRSCNTPILLSRERTACPIIHPFMVLCSAYVEPQTFDVRHLWICHLPISCSVSALHSLGHLSELRWVLSPQQSSGECAVKCRTTSAAPRRPSPHHAWQLRQHRDV